MRSVVASVLLVTVIANVCQRCQSQQQLSTITLFQVGFVGQKLTMTCRPNVNQTGAAQWGQLTDAGVGVFFTIPYSSESDGVIASTPTELGYTLTIVSVANELAGSYSLRFDGSASATCIIYLAVIDVVIDVVNRSDVIVGGDLISLTCRLTVDAQRLLSVYSAIPINVTISDDTGYVWNVSTFSRDATVNLNAQVPSTVAQTQYFCTARYNNFYKQVNTTVFRVSYPVRNVALNVSNNTQISVSDVISCHSDAYPVAHIFVWEYYENSSRWSAFSAANGPTFTLISAGNITIRCTAFNVIRNVTYQVTSSGVHLEVFLIKSGAGSTRPDPVNGAAVGISIGVVCGFLIITAIVLSIYCVKKKRRKHKEKRTDDDIGLSKSDNSLSNGVNNRVSTIDDLVLVDNTLYGQNQPHESYDKDANRDELNTRNSYDASNVYAEIRSSMVGKIISPVDNPSKSKLAHHHQPPESRPTHHLQPPQLISPSSNVSTSNSDLTLVENDLYGYGSGIDNTPITMTCSGGAYETLDEVALSNC